MVAHLQQERKITVKAGGSSSMSLDVQGIAPLLQVFDMRVAIRFYRDVLGCTVRMRSPALSVDPDHVNWCLLELQGTELMLNTAYDPEVQPARPDAARWAAHSDTCIYFGCPDVDAAYQHLRSLGLDPAPPKTAPYGMKQLYLKDPDGYGLCCQWKA
jgi:glyoxylase I family protein